MMQVQGLEVGEKPGVVLEQSSAIVLKEPYSKLCLHSATVMLSMICKERGVGSCVPVKLYLQKRALGWV